MGQGQQHYGGSTQIIKKLTTYLDYGKITGLQITGRLREDYRKITGRLQEGYRKITGRLREDYRQWPVVEPVVQVAAVAVAVERGVGCSSSTVVAVSLLLLLVKKNQTVAVLLLLLPSAGILLAFRVLFRVLFRV